MKKTISVLLLLAMLVSLFAGLTLTAEAAQPTSASAVNYRKSGSYVYNWGKRDTVATFLTTYAQDYYTGSYSYATLSALSGDSGTGTDFYSSQLGTAIHNMLEAKQSYTTSYNGTRDLYKYTDCEENADKISSYYSGVAIGPNWGSSPTWNREHTWPDSKGQGGSDENDIMMLRPTAQSENGNRGNTAYGKSGSYYDPNQNGQNLHGDVARLMLQHLMRWGNTSKFYGTGGVMESRAVLIEWMIEDPVDTWEMGRNDAVQAITGVRNVFVDYPELAFKLLGATMPATYQTPSGSNMTSYTITATTNNSTYGTVSVSGMTITASPKTGYYAESYTVTSGTATVTQNGNLFTVVPTSDCTVRINFAAKQSASLSFSVPAGVTTPSTISGYSGDVKTLPTPSGTPSGGSYTYTFKGWVSASVKDVTSQPATVYAAGSSYTLSGNTTLYALYSYFVDDGQGSSQTRWQLITDLTKFDAGTYALLTPNYKAFNGTFSSGNGLVTSSAFSFDASGYADTAPSGTLELTAEATTGGFRLYNESKGYLYTTKAGSGGLSFSEGTAKGVWTGESAALKCVEGSVTAHLRTYSNSSFRPYSSASTNEALLLAKKVGGVSGTTYYTTVIGNVQTHTPILHNAVDATCTAAGSVQYYTCAECTTSGTTHYNKKYSDAALSTQITTTSIPALDHNYTNYTVTTAPTTAATGTLTGTCSRCGGSTTVTLQKLNTTYYAKTSVTAATCTATGTDRYTWKTTNYGTFYFDVTTAALGHNYSAFTSNGDGTHSKTCSRCHDIITEDCTMFNGTCSVCGYEEAELSIDSASLVLNGYIDIVYTVDVPAGFINPYMIVEGPNGIQTINRFTQEGTKLSFTYTGITPQCMGDNVSATLYATKDGRIQAVTKSEYSVRQYCVNQLKGSISLKLRRLLSNLLAYGAAAQTYMNYKTDALVTSGDDIKSPAYSTFPGLSGLSAQFDGTAAADTCWAGVGLTLTDGVAMNFCFYAENINGLSVQVTMGDRTETFTEFNAVEGKDGVYEISFEGIKATEFGSTVTAKFYRNNAQIGNAVSYSVNTYVCAKQNDSNTLLTELVQRLYNYGVSAASYAN